MPRRAPDIEQFLADVRAELSDTAMMGKYELNKEQLYSYYNELVNEGQLSMAELLGDLPPPPEPGLLLVESCPRCKGHNLVDAGQCVACGAVLLKGEGRKIPRKPLTPRSPSGTTTTVRIQPIPAGVVPIEYETGHPVLPVPARASDEVSAVRAPSAPSGTGIAPVHGEILQREPYEDDSRTITMPVELTLDELISLASDSAPQASEDQETEAETAAPVPREYERTVRLVDLPDISDDTTDDTTEEITIVADEFELFIPEGTEREGLDVAPEDVFLHIEHSDTAAVTFEPDVRPETEFEFSLDDDEEPSKPLDSPQDDLRLPTNVLFSQTMKAAAIETDSSQGGVSVHERGADADFGGEPGAEDDVTELIAGDAPDDTFELTITSGDVAPEDLDLGTGEAEEDVSFTLQIPTDQGPRDTQELQFEVARVAQTLSDFRSPQDGETELLAAFHEEQPQLASSARSLRSRLPILGGILCGVLIFCGVGLYTGIMPLPFEDGEHPLSVAEEMPPATVRTAAKTESARAPVGSPQADDWQRTSGRGTEPDRERPVTAPPTPRPLAVSTQEGMEGLPPQVLPKGKKRIPAIPAEVPQPTPVRVAVAPPDESSKPAVKVLPENAPKERLSPPRETDLMGAVRDHDAQRVARLIDKGADPQAKGEGGVTPLILAATQGSDALVDLLLLGGADPNGTDDKGSTPLMHAAGRGRLNTVRLLLSKGADPEKTDNEGRAALHRAYAPESMLFTSVPAYREIVRLLREQAGHRSRAGETE